jgi:ABC-2 type transport system permease protein
MWAFLLYHILTAHALWPAPVYCWLLLVSGWARRAILLWAAVPVLVIGGLEKLMFHTSNFLTMVGSRLIGNTATAAMMPANGFPTDPMTHVTIGRFLVSPGLWLGLLISAAFLSAAIRLRRSRGAI